MQSVFTIKLLLFMFVHEDAVIGFQVYASDDEDIWLIFKQVTFSCGLVVPSIRHGNKQL